MFLVAWVNSFWGIAKLNGRRILMLKFPKFCLLKPNIPTFNSLFGNLYYQKSINLFENSKLESYENALLKVERNYKNEKRF